MAACRFMSDADPAADPLAGLPIGADPGAPACRWEHALFSRGGARRGVLTAGPWRDFAWAAVVDEAEDSQFDRILTELRAGADSGPGAAIALCGKKFHGYRGRPWTARRGNLHLSAVFPVGQALGSAAVALTAIPAVAVLDALRPWTRSSFCPGIKWVNDILADGRKVSGVITATQSRGAVTESVVFGIGLNLAVAPEVEPSVFVPAAGCVRDALGAAAPGLGEVFTAVSAALAARVRQLLTAGPAPILNAYRAGSLLTGEAVRVWDEATVNDLDEVRRQPASRLGVVDGILDDLSLRLADDPVPVSRGRLALESVCREFGL